MTTRASQRSDSVPPRAQDQRTAASSHPGQQALLTRLQQTAGNAAVVEALQRQIVGPASGASLAGNRAAPSIQRQIAHDVEKRWGYEISGSLTLTAGDSTVSQGLAQHTTNIELPSHAEATLELRMTPKRYKWLGTFRWSDKKKKFEMFHKTYRATWRVRIDDQGRPLVNFANDADRKHSFEASPFPEIKMFEMGPDAHGSRAIVKVIAFGPDSEKAETTLTFNVIPPVDDVREDMIAIERSLVLRNFARGKSDLTADHVQKIDEFWNSLTPATRRAIEHDQLLSNEKVRVYGFASTTDRVQDNFWLSGARAKMVANALMLKSGNQNLNNMSPIARGEVPEPTDVRAEEREEGRHRAVVVVLWDIGDGQR